MKTTWFLPVVFFAILNLVAGKDLGPIIRIARCRSMCLQTYGIAGGECENEKDNCQQCWHNCDLIEHMEKEARHDACEKRHIRNFTIPMDLSEQTLDRIRKLFRIRKKSPLVQQHLSWESVCTFFRTKGADIETYDASKLPAPETAEIHMDGYDVAVVMHKTEVGWVENGYYTSKQQPILAPLGWIIVVDDKGTIRHYSWERWWPNFNTLVVSDTLDQAYITWHDWRSQLKQQRDVRLKDVGASKLELLDKHEKSSKPSFVVTWQQETGYGITGNQVTDCEEAQISLSSGNNYVVRVASKDGPGSFPITIQARRWTEIEIKFFDVKFTLAGYVFTFALVNVLLIGLIALIELRLLRRRYRMDKMTWKRLEKALIEGYVIKVEKMKVKSIGTKSEKMQLAKDLKEHLLGSIVLDIDEPEKKNQTIQTTNTNTKDDTIKDEHSDRVK